MTLKRSNPGPNNKAGEEKYERILNASKQVFAAKGFHESKISEIARTAGVADGTIYLYFKNKDDILISLFEVLLESVNSGLPSSLGGSPASRGGCGTEDDAESEGQKEHRQWRDEVSSQQCGPRSPVRQRQQYHGDS